VNIAPDALLHAVGLAAVAATAAAGVLEAERKRIDLVGAVFIALAAALAGGTLRDVLLDRKVFWVADQSHLLAAMLAGVLTFFAARRRAIPARLFLYPDAIGLALFTVVGTQVALQAGSPWLVASLMGVTTGVFGGIARDLLCNRMPLVMQRGELYATASWFGALLVIAVAELGGSPMAAAWTGMGTVLAIRLLAMHFSLRLPVLEEVDGERHD
jgi:uncharacterized membrane protein YeiH